MFGYFICGKVGGLFASMQMSSSSIWPDQSQWIKSPDSNHGM